MGRFWAIWVCFQLSISNSFAQAPQPYLAYLVFEGGGVRGIAYAGALEVLEQAQTLEKLESTAGTSVGGLVAVLYAVGYSPCELMDVLADLKIQRFNDGRWMFVGGFTRMNRNYGWYRGERFENWVAGLVQRKTGNSNTTFADLHTLREKNPRIKDPMLFATDLTWQRATFFPRKLAGHVAAPRRAMHDVVVALFQCRASRQRDAAGAQTQKEAGRTA